MLASSRVLNVVHPFPPVFCCNGAEDEPHLSDVSHKSAGAGPPRYFPFVAASGRRTEGLLARSSCMWHTVTCVPGVAAKRRRAKFVQRFAQLSCGSAPNQQPFALTVRVGVVRPGPRRGEQRAGFLDMYQPLRYAGWRGGKPQERARSGHSTEVCRLVWLIIWPGG